MGNTTIIELNHDLANEIKVNPEKFLKQINEQLGSAVHTGVRIPGGRIVAFFHRSGGIEIAWTAWKVRWGIRERGGTKHEKA